MGVGGCGAKLRKSMVLYFVVEGSGGKFKEQLKHVEEIE